MPDLTELARKKLIVTRQLFDHALLLSARHSNITARLLALIGFDLANETLLRALVTELDPGRAPTDSFQGLIQQADEVLARSNLPGLPSKASIQHVHAIRNDAQHKARYPNENDVADALVYTRDFLDAVCLSIWQRSLRQISLAELVHHSTVRDYLVRAENAAMQGDSIKAVEFSVAGLTLALDAVREATVGRIHWTAGGIAITDTFGRPMARHEGEAVLRAFLQTQDTVLFLALGLDLPGLFRFRQIAGSVVFAIDGTPFFQHRSGEFSRDEVDFALSYGVNSVLAIENSVGSLDRPFVNL